MVIESEIFLTKYIELAISFLEAFLHQAKKRIGTNRFVNFNFILLATSKNSIHNAYPVRPFYIFRC